MPHVHLRRRYCASRKTSERIGMMTLSSGSSNDVRLDDRAAESLREWRWARGRSMEQCAQRLAIPLVDFLAKERGKTGFTASELRTLLDFLDIDAKQLRR